MNEELEVLKDVCEKINKLGISYIISGSMSANYYTIPRMTRDIDIVIKLKIEDVDSFVREFEDSYYIDEEMVKKAVSEQRMFNIIHNLYVVKVDFIPGKNTEFQNAMFLRRKKVKIKEFLIWIISPEDLILMKMVWAKESNSEMQLSDVRNILDTVDDLDIKYVEDWTCKLSISGLYKRLKNERQG